MQIIQRFMFMILSSQLEPPALSVAGALCLLGVWATPGRAVWVVPLHRGAAHLLHLPCIFHRRSRGRSARRRSKAGLRAAGSRPRPPCLRSRLLQVSWACLQASQVAGPVLFQCVSPAAGRCSRSWLSQWRRCWHTRHWGMHTSTWHTPGHAKHMSVCHETAALVLQVGVVQRKHTFCVHDAATLRLLVWTRCLCFGPFPGPAQPSTARSGKHHM